MFSARTGLVANTEWKPLIKAIVRVSRDVLHRSAKTGLWSSTSEVAYYLALPRWFRRIGKPLSNRNPKPLARREQTTLHPRHYLPGGSIAHPS
jgi:hypothetical protein